MYSTIDCTVLTVSFSSDPRLVCIQHGYHRLAAADCSTLRGDCGSFTYVFISLLAQN